MKNKDKDILSEITLAPWIQKATQLKSRERKVGGNQFRHQGSTLFILIDYNYIDNVLLKASLIHDLIEEYRDEVNLEDLRKVDSHGPDVVKLVLEVTRRQSGTGRESKREYLQRIRTGGSVRARVLKCGDRIQNLTDLNSDFPNDFIRRYVQETKAHVLPMAQDIDTDMACELQYLIDKLSRETALKL